ncbi:hypothetical protein AOLI_G00243550 [Acnodon oligacanthus]
MDLKWVFVLFLISEMDQTWVSIIFFSSAVCGVSANIPHRYHFVNENKTWTEAQSFCRQTYTDLATIGNMDEMKKLNATLKEKPRSPAWIGLARGDIRKWLWSLSDRRFYREGDTYRSWSFAEPNNYWGMEYCVVMFTDMKMETGKWFDVICDVTYASVCYDETKTSTKRYVFINEKKTWHDAQSYCRKHHTDLVSVRNQTESQQILSKIDSNVEFIWIGLFNDSWQWSDQSDSSFRYWMSGPENYGKGESCAAVFEQGYWNNVNCNKKLPFTCHENQLILIKQNLTWREALRYCEDHHVDLVSVHSEEIQLWVMEVAQNASTEHVWLGLRHTCTLSFWFWVSGESICYQNWAPGNGTGGEDCGSGERTGAVQSRGGQQWVSLPEDQKLNFICLTYEEVDQKWISIILLFSAACGVSPYVPHQYHFVNEGKTWTEAQSYCRQTYTDLATINNMEEMKQLNSTRNQLKDAPNSSVWIGLNRGDAGKWLWSLADGSFYRDGDTYRNWKSGEPNNWGTQVEV